MINYSVIIPVYNSSSTIVGLTSRLANFFNTRNESFELILVDDGSSDNSWKTIEEVKKKCSFNLRGIKLNKNYGQHNATLCGITHSSGNLIITIDDDLQFPPEEIAKLIDCYTQTQADIIYGIPNVKQHSAIRNVGTTYIKLTSDQPKGGSSFRLIKKSICDEITKNHHGNFLFLDTIFTWYTNNIETIAVNHEIRKSGKSGYSYKKLIYLYFDILINYSALPLRIMTYGGLISSLITFIFGLRFIYKKLIHNVPLGYTSLIVSILFSTSLILLCLGIIGQYLYKLYQIQNKKPTYSIQKVLK